MELKNDVLEREPNEAVAKLYRAKINELIATTRMLRAAKNGDDYRFSKYAEFIYGKPDRESMAYVTTHVKQLIEEFHEHPDPNLKAAADLLAEEFAHADFGLVEGADRSVLETNEPKHETDLVESAAEAEAVFVQALQELAIDDWTVLVDSELGISSFSVSQEHKTIRIPADEYIEQRKLNRKELKGLIAHEIGTHVARRHHGERSKLMLLGLGLDRYIQAEEGVATYNEQAVTGAKEFAGVPRFLSIALAKGLTGEPKDFRGTFVMMRAYQLLAKADEHLSVAEVEQIAYNDCVRIFRGTTCNTPGAVYPKDMSYFANRKIWSLVSQNSEVVKQFQIGKFDPTNEQHVTLLTQLGILDEDLQKLEAGSGDKNVV